MHRRWVSAPVLTAVVVAALAGPVAAAGPRVPSNIGNGPFGLAADVRAPVAPRFAISRSDGNDVRGALDLRSLRITRGRGSDVMVFSTYDAVSNQAIDPDNGNFAVGIDTNDNRRFEYFQYVFFAGGRIRGVLVNIITGRVIDGTVATSRVNPRTFKTQIPLRKIGGADTYRLALFGYYEASPCTRRDPCLDVIPQRFPLIPMDHEAPSFEWGTVPVFSTDAVDDLTYPITFSVEDDRFGTGVKSWTVQRKEVGAGTGFTDVKSGRAGDPTVQVPGVQGATYDVRVIVVDKQRNKRVSASRRTTIPWDDANAGTGEGEFTYSAEVANTGVAGAFLGTTHSIANTTTATVMLAAGSRMCILGGATAVGTATADVTLDGAVLTTITEETTTAALAQVFCVTGFAGGSLVITGTSIEPVVLDAIAVKP